MAKGKGKGRDGIHAPLTLAGPSSKWHTPPTACSRSTTAQWTAGHTSPSASSLVRALGGQWAAAMARQWGRTCASLLFRGHSHPENHISCRLASPARQGRQGSNAERGPTSTHVQHLTAQHPCCTGSISRKLYGDMVGVGWAWFASKDPATSNNQNFYVRAGQGRQGEGNECPCVCDAPGRVYIICRSFVS